MRGENFMDKSNSKEKVAESITNNLLAGAAQIHKIYEPQWDARADVLKTIVSLSSASIVLSVTFSSSLRAAKLDPAWRYLVVLSFAMFVVSLVIALIALWVGTHVYEIQSGTLDARRKVRQAFMDATSNEDFMAAFEEIQSPVSESIGKSDKLASRLFRACSATFLLAIICLAVVGAKQILS
jgi:hypothetical protein